MSQVPPQAAAPGLAWRPLRQRAGGQQQGTDGDEGQPEARRQDGPGVRQQYRQQGEGEDVAGRHPAAAGQGQGGGAEHGQGAQGRHPGTGQQGVAGCRQPAGQERRPLGRPARHEGWRAAPQAAGQGGGKGRHHGHVEPGNAHQVGGAGAGEDLPLVAGNGLLVPHRQGGEDAGVGIVGLRQAGLEVLPHRLAQPLDAAEEAVAAAQQAVVPSFAHIAGGADAPFQEPGLVVETGAVGVAVGALQAHRQLPFLARLQARSGRFRPVVPGEQEGRRQVGSGPGRHSELEALAPAKVLGQGGDAALQLQILPFQCRRQPFGKAGLGPPAGPQETQGRGQQDCSQAGQGAGPPSQCQQPEGRRRPQGQPGPGRQGWLLLQQDDAQGEGIEGPVHGNSIATFAPGLALGRPGAGAVE